MPTTPSPTPIPIPPHSHSASMPIAKHGFSTGSEGSLSRAKNLHDDSLRARHVVWLEQLHHDGQPMLDEFLGRMDARYHDFAETISQIAEVRTFVRTAGLGVVNEDEFSAMIGAVFRRLVVAEELEFEGGDGVRYMRSGSNGMHAQMHGHPWVEDGGVPRDRRFALKPDFFTARVRGVAGEWAPWRDKEMEKERTASSSLPTLPPPVLTNTSNRFAWDDPHVLWEVKSSADTLNATPVLSNLILKATETLRFQWQRHFVLVFLVCGTSLRMLRCE
ncbi:hypothetical protein GP486_007258 [Trichoglossum hirsutum]|uniref:Uncharacterized protein n=1 Tax=Trichoglossum hirsutum TaxID=265104 RepID=A0A9P8IG49_9PEZI|nr:hypothetical protein GP486_007258 [Trichoglossum hirsutum]